MNKESIKSKQNRQLIETACQLVMKKQGLSMSPRQNSELCANWIIDEIIGYNEIFPLSDVIGIMDEDCETAELNLWLTALSSIVCMEFILISDLREKHKQPILWENHNVDKELSKIIFQSVFSQLCNYNLAMLKIAKMGLDNQFLIIFRGYLELTEQALLLLIEYDFFEKYQTWLCLSGDLQSKNNYNHWKNHISPSIVRKKLDKVILREGISNETAKNRKEARFINYSWLSQHHHGNPNIVILRSFGANGPKVGGKFDIDTINVLRKLTEFNFDFFCFLRLALGKYQFWTMDPNKQLCVDFQFKWELLIELSLILMNEEGCLS